MVSYVNHVIQVVKHALVTYQQTAYHAKTTHFTSTHLTDANLVSVHVKHAAPQLFVFHVSMVIIFRI